MQWKPLPVPPRPTPAAAPVVLAMNGYMAEGWVSCRCGKTVYRWFRQETQELADSMLRLAQVTLCRACEAETTKGLDACPESVFTDTGVVACKLTWHHTGRCEPFDADAEWDPFHKSEG